MINGGTATAFMTAGSGIRRNSIDEEAAATRRVVVADERMFRTGKHGLTQVMSVGMMVGCYAHAPQRRCMVDVCIKEYETLEKIVSPPDPHGLCGNTHKQILTL